MFLWDTSSLSLWFAHFLDKITVPGPTACLSIIGQSRANRTSLDSVTFQKPHTVHHDLGFSLVPLFFFHSFSLSLLSVLCSPSSLWLVIPSPPAHGSALWSWPVSSGSHGGHRKPMVIRGWGVEVRIWGALRENLGEWLKIPRVN